MRADSKPSEKPPMKPEVILTPDQLTQRLQNETKLGVRKMPPPGRLARETNGLHALREIFAFLLAGHLRVDAQCQQPPAGISGRR
jgi:hypothetical protein